MEGLMIHSQFAVLDLAALAILITAVAGGIVSVYLAIKGRKKK